MVVGDGSSVALGDRVVEGNCGMVDDIIIIINRLLILAKFSKKNAIQHTRMNSVVIIEAAFTILTVFVIMIKK